MEARKTKFSEARRRVITILFMTLMGLQVLDMHSTIISMDSRTELNKFIQSIASWIGMTGAVVAAKGIAIAAIAFLMRSWKQSTDLDGPVGLSLAVMCVAYGITVVNNYVA